MQVDDRELGSFLVDARLLSRGTLERALARPHGEGVSLYDVLLLDAAVPEDELRRAAARVLGVPFVVLESHDISPDDLLIVPEPLARTHSAFAYRARGGTVEVALLDLEDLDALRFLEAESHVRLVPRLTDRASLTRGLLLYQKTLKEKFSALVQNGEGVVDALINHAILSRVGGVHLDLSTTGMLVRYRINQSLHEAMRLPAHVGESLSAKLKTLAKLLPTSSTLQEGRFKVEHMGDRHTVHVSAQKTAQGEKLHLRFAREAHGQSGFSLRSLGFHGETLEHVHRALGARSGLIVVSGGEGSGKTTMLYTLLDQLVAPHRAVHTVERQIVRHIPHVAQVGIGGTTVSYGAAVRAALKQDPDVLMLDTIPNGEVAALATAAAARGVLVLAGIEAPPIAAEAVQQLRTLGVSPLTLAATLKLIIAPQVLDRLCEESGTTHLSRADGAPLEARANFGRVLATLKEEGVLESEVQWKEVEFASPKACANCERGYKGLVGLQEVLPITLPIKELILRGEDTEVIDQAAREGGMLTLIEDGLFKAAEKQTSVEKLTTLI